MNNTLHVVWKEGMVIFGLNEEETDNNKDQDNCNFKENGNIIDTQ